MSRLKFCASILMLFVLASCGKKSRDLLLDTAVSPWAELVNTNDSLAIREISSLAVDKAGNLYAAGSIYADVALRYNCVVKWDGGQWVALGGTKAIYSIHKIRAVTTDNDGNVYTAYIGYNNKTTVVKWDGNSWTQLGTFSLFDILRIYAIKVDADKNVYVGGITDGGYKSKVARWDGTSWTELYGSKGFVDNYYNGFVLDLDKNGQIQAAATDYVRKWDGNDWRKLGGDSVAGVWGPISCLVTDAKGNTYIAGDFIGSKGYCYVSYWNGRKWGVLGDENDILNITTKINSLFLDDKGNIYVVGDYTNLDYNPSAFKWDGNSWSELGGYNSIQIKGELNTIVGDGQGNIYVAVNKVNYDTAATVIKYSERSK